MICKANETRQHQTKLVSYPYDLDFGFDLAFGKTVWEALLTRLSCPACQMKSVKRITLGDTLAVVSSYLDPWTVASFSEKGRQFIQELQEPTKETG